MVGIVDDRRQKTQNDKFVQLRWGEGADVSPECLNWLGQIFCYIEFFKASLSSFRVLQTVYVSSALL